QGGAALVSAVAAGVVEHLDRAAVQAHGPAGDGQAQAGAAGGIGVAAALEPLEHPRAVLTRDAGTLVVHVDAHAGAVPGAGGGDVDPPAGGGVACRVLQEVVDDLVEPRRIRGHPQVRRVHVDDPAHVAAPGGEGCGVHDLVEERGELHRLDVQIDDPGVQPREVQEVVDQLREPLRLGEGYLERRRVRLGDAVHEVLQLGAQARDRGAQLVGDVRDEV